jgi:ATP-binding cassette subfamily B protein
MRLRWAPAAALLPEYFSVSRPLSVIVVFAAVVSGALTPVLTIATGALVGAVEAGRSAVPALAAVGAVFLLERLLGPVDALATGALARRVDERLTERLMASVAGPPGLAHVEDPKVLDAVAKAQGALQGTNPAWAVYALRGVWAQRLQGVLSLAIVFSWRWWAALAIAVTCGFGFAISRWQYQHVTLVMHGRTEKLRRVHYLRRLALTEEMAKETRVFGLAGWLVDRYRTRWLAVMRDIWSKRQEGWLAAVGGFALIGGVEILVLTALVRDGGVSTGRAVVVAGAVLASAVLGMFHGGHRQLVEALEGMGELEALERAARASAGGVVGGTASAEALPRREIRFEGVGFTYPGRERPLFQSLDLAIEAGRSLAIVGENGAGKTTLVKLLARLYDPQAGRITVDGQDLREIAPGSWHRRVAAIFQDFVQFELTAYDNVAFGALARTGDRAAVAQAAERAGAERVVQRLTDGWQTPLSRQLKGGAQLSGGEWQRLALARALFAVNAGAGVLVLDEPTASLDVRGEAEVYEKFLELTRGVTTIVISHRFSTVRRADRIVVLEGGRVIEDGTHDELVRAGGRYATMYALQAARFEEAPGA